MSVIMTLEVNGDPKALEQFASENQDKMEAVLEAATSHGLIAHRFYGSDDGTKLLVLDEWPDRESFEAFFREQESQIAPMFEAVRAMNNPDPTFWQVLETPDKFGWNA